MENINTKAKNAKIVMSGTNIISRVFVVEKIPGRYESSCQNDYFPKYADRP